jgi:hypothetical protein
MPGLAILRLVALRPMLDGPRRGGADVFTCLTDDLFELVATELRENDLYAANLSDCCCLACCSCCCAGNN